MGASNFARGNTSKVFAVLMNTEEKYSKCNECEEKNFEWEEDYIEVGGTCSCSCSDIEHDTEYRAVESWEIDDFKYYLKEVAQNHSVRTDLTYSEESGSDGDRNYPASNIFSLYTSKSYGDIEIEIKITALLVGAYYEGASLDYRLEISHGEWSEIDKNFSVADITENLFEVEYSDHSYSQMSRGLRTITSKKAVKWAEKQTEKMIETIENIFTEVSQPLNVVAQFSNGETIYEKV